MSGTINNGRREEVAFGLYDGEAGILEIDGETIVSFPGYARRFSVGIIGMIGGDAFRVTKVEASKLVSAMVLLTVAAVTPASSE